MEGECLVLTTESVDKIVWCGHACQLTEALLADGSLGFYDFTKSNFVFFSNFHIGHR